MSGAKACAGWLVSREYDLAFLVNAWWPAFAVLCACFDFSESAGFWQIYLLTTPHRWITPLLVAADPDRRQVGAALLAAVPLLMLALVVGAWGALGQVAPLIALDAVWNGWHFGGQHAGIAAVYGQRRTSRAQVARSWLVRLCVFGVALRAMGWNSDISTVLGLPSWTAMAADSLLFTGLVSLLVLAWTGRPVPSTAASCYLTSVGLAYLLLLGAICSGERRLVMAMALSTACMHAGEYLAFIGYYASRRATMGSRGLFSRMAAKWGVVLAGFVLFSAFLATIMEWIAPIWFVLVNLASALTHYAHDGLIWRMRRPETASVLAGGVTGA